MNFKSEKIKIEQGSPIDKLFLEKSDLELLPTVEQMLNDIEKAVANGKSEASKIIQSSGLIGKIKEIKDGVLLLDKSAILGFIGSYVVDEEHPQYSQVESLLKNFTNTLGDYKQSISRIRIPVDSSNIKENNNFVRVEVIATLSHEILHNLPKNNIEITWINEAITERLTQGLLSDLIYSSDEWKNIFQNLTEEEDTIIRFGSYKEERNELAEFCEKIYSDCLSYSKLPKESYSDRRKGGDIVFFENFLKLYFEDDSFALERNVKELGYSSILELSKLDPNLI